MLDKYDNFMVALMDSAQTSDYWPVDLLPMPYTQAALWDAFDNRPVTLRHAAEGETPPAHHSDHVRLPARNQQIVDDTAKLGDKLPLHVEEFYVYKTGLPNGDNTVVVWYKCGCPLTVDHPAPTWMVLERAP